MSMWMRYCCKKIHHHHHHLRGYRRVRCIQVHCITQRYRFRINIGQITSAAFLAELSVSSPRKLFIFNIYKNIF